MFFETSRRVVKLSMLIAAIFASHSLVAKEPVSQALDEKQRPLFGVQRWDMFAGIGSTQRQELGYLPGRQAFLKPEEFHHRAPFYTRRTKDVDWVDHPKNAGPLWFNHPFDFQLVQDSMDKEIDFATDAGIDFFIFNGPTRVLEKSGYGLNQNLDAYMNNIRKDKVKFVRALYGHGLVDRSRSRNELMLDVIIEYMQSPFWQTVKGGRPLLPILRPLTFEKQLAAQTDPAEQMTLTEFISQIRSRVKKAGLKDPYIVGYEIARTYEHKDKYIKAGIDAFTDYAGAYGGTTTERDDSPTYAQATEVMIQTWQDNAVSKQQEIYYVPAMAIGSYMWPRAKDKKWYHYQLPKAGDITKRVEQTFEFIEKNKTKASAEIIFSYSWNEHSEAGAINPTMGDSPEYIPNTRWLDEVALGLPGISPRKINLIKNQENK